MAKTNWYVITGGPCSGKTSVLEILEQRGYKTQPEAARIFFDRELAKGKTIEQIRKDEGKVQQKLLKLKKQIESKLPKDELIFLDRAIPDSVAYYEISGLSPQDEELIKLVKASNYKKIFLFELVKYKQDNVRTDSQHAKKIEKLLEKYYRLHDFEIIRVPDMGQPEKRVEFILKNL